MLCLRLVEGPGRGIAVEQIRRLWKGVIGVVAGGALELHSQQQGVQDGFCRVLAHE